MVLFEGNTILTFTLDIKTLDILDLRIHGLVDGELGTIMDFSKIH